MSQYVITERQRQQLLANGITEADLTQFLLLPETVGTLTIAGMPYSMHRKPNSPGYILAKDYSMLGLHPAAPMAVTK